MIDLGLTSGTLWAANNIGATCGDTAESWYGNYYAWGETETKEDYSWSTYKHVNGASNKLTKYCPLDNSDYWDGEGDPDNKLILDAVDDIATQIYGSNYRMPTKSEIEELIELPNQWVTDYNGISGLNGRVFTGNGNTLFIPAAGGFNESTHSDAASGCSLWSGSLYSDHPDYAWNPYFNSGNVTIFHFNRCLGFSIRAVC